MKGAAGTGGGVMTGLSRSLALLRIAGPAFVLAVMAAVIAPRASPPPRTVAGDTSALLLFAGMPASEVAAVIRAGRPKPT